MVRPSVAGYAMLAALAACGGSDPKQQLEKIDSAAATTALTSEELRARHVSRHYARVMLALLRDETTTTAQNAKAPRAVRARADSVRRLIERALAAADADAR
jgi:hypothetical protein